MRRTCREREKTRLILKKDVANRRVLVRCDPSVVGLSSGLFSTDLDLAASVGPLALLDVEALEELELESVRLFAVLGGESDLALRDRFRG